jgi:hypothetical protein
MKLNSFYKQISLTVTVFGKIWGSGERKFMLQKKTIVYLLLDSSLAHFFFVFYCLSAIWAVY